VLAPKSLDHHGTSYVILRAANITAATLFFVLLSLSVFGVHFFGAVGSSILLVFSLPPIGWSPEYAAFFITRSILLLTVFAPLYLLWRGERLAHIMAAEIDRCVTDLAKRAMAEAQEPDFDEDNFQFDTDDEIPF
jgi:hypothetical protein